VNYDEFINYAYNFNKLWSGFEYIRKQINKVIHALMWVVTY